MNYLMFRKNHQEKILDETPQMSEEDVEKLNQVQIVSDPHGTKHNHGDDHSHVNITPFAKVLIAMECPWSLYAYNFRYMLGVKGSFHAGFDTATWVYYTNIFLFVASLLAVILAVITDSNFQKYTVLVIGFLVSIISSFILFAVSILTTGQYEKIMNAVGLFWGLLFITVEPLRVAVFFDQLPSNMDSHLTAHVFLMYQEMKTVGSVMYFVLTSALQYGSKAYGKTAFPLAIIYFIVPVMYIFVVIAFWKTSHPGEFSYSIGVDCMSSFARALHLTFLKRVKYEGHWLDTAVGEYDAKTIRTTKTMYSLIFVFTTLVTYGMAQTLMKNTWNDQSRDLIEDLHIKYYYRDYNVVLFALTIALLPFIEYFFLPQIYKRRRGQKPYTELQRIGITVFLTGASFAMTTILQLAIEKYSTPVPSGSRSQVRLFNVQDENVNISGNWVFDVANIPSKSMVQALNMKSQRISLSTITVTFGSSTANKSIKFTSLLATVRGKSISYMVGEHELMRVNDFDPIVFGPPGTNVPDMVRIYFINYGVSVSGTYAALMNPNDKLTFKNLNGKTKHGRTIRIPQPFSRIVFQLHPGEYEILCQIKRPAAVIGSCTANIVTIKQGGIYAVLPLLESTFQTFKIYTICKPADYSIYLMLPQIITLAFAVAMGKIPINVFLFKESPRETRVSTLALFFFSQDGSSIIFAIFNDVFRFRVDSFQLVLMTGIHTVFCFFFVYAALKHHTFSEEDATRRRRALYKSVQISKTDLNN